MLQKRNTQNTTKIKVILKIKKIYTKNRKQSMEESLIAKTIVIMREKTTHTRQPVCKFQHQISRSPGERTENGESE